MSRSSNVRVHLSQGTSNTAIGGGKMRTRSSRRGHFHHLGSISFTCDRNNLNLEQDIEVDLGPDAGSGFHKHQPRTLFNGFGVQIIATRLGIDGKNQQSLGRFILRLFGLVPGQPVGEDGTERPAVTRAAQPSLNVALGNTRQNDAASNGRGSSGTTAAVQQMRIDATGQSGTGGGDDDGLTGTTRADGRDGIFTRQSKVRIGPSRRRHDGHHSAGRRGHGRGRFVDLSRRGDDGNASSSHRSGRHITGSRQEERRRHTHGGEGSLSQY
mmetsp:Transcript_18779/g.54072  ORF Transcript_18779/g.54072 Transcript_18779/m.54072 type:complete len:269 (-) Transcript_18779:118-924(-)